MWINASVLVCKREKVKLCVLAHYRQFHAIVECNNSPFVQFMDQT